MTTPIPRHEIIQAYRSLYRGCLRAVQYRRPQRFILTERLARAFRSSPPEDFSPAHIANTIRFLEYAARYRGTEHKLVRSLAHVWWGEGKTWGAYARRANDGSLKSESYLVGARVVTYDNFYWTLEQLNKSMGLCIR